MAAGIYNELLRVISEKGVPDKVLPHRFESDMPANMVEIPVEFQISTLKQPIKQKIIFDTITINPDSYLNCDPKTTNTGWTGGSKTIIAFQGESKEYPFAHLSGTFSEKDEIVGEKQTKNPILTVDEEIFFYGQDCPDNLPRPKCSLLFPLTVNESSEKYQIAKGNLAGFKI